ncbi:hypothetical protein IDM40_02935 [Nocardiopsis sp. HNM0947]|uniref:Uncharacterized protein n=1 Tax=Nocardiopsis coralli TaxID=2772213 RepID=A0ABR9P1N6_9ACTN|nr:hypothetical protein [Nocardiopsis coralli]MBE2997665.1 hypothetical protein [Nocardiopsis coralli]
MQDFHDLWRRSTVAELSWLSPGGPCGIPVVPLDDGGRPCAALPLSLLPEIDSLPGRAALSVTVPGVADPDRPGQVAVGPVEVRLDPRGKLFGGELVEQEAHKHPPTRLRAGSLMARNENWWWMGRALVFLSEAESVHTVRPRSSADHALLVREEHGAPAVRVVSSPDWSVRTDRPSLPLADAGGTALEGRGEKVLVFGHQASPDFERWERWTREGTLTGQDLVVAGAEGGPDPSPRPFGLLERLRNHREVERACTAGVAELERRERL